MRPYHLAQHVFACVNGDHLVLLDLQRDKYFALDSGKARRLAEFVCGLETLLSTAEVSRGTASAQEESLCNTLLVKGLITNGSGKEIAPLRIPVATTQFLSRRPFDRKSIPAGAIIALILAYLCAALSLRYLPIRRVVHRVERRKARSRQWSIEEARKYSRWFEYLRPFFFSGRDACLLQSLTLLEFLSWYHVYPSWVFGVQTGPFAAHCWVQHDRALFDDVIENVRSYTPIMIV